MESPLLVKQRLSSLYSDGLRSFKHFVSSATSNALYLTNKYLGPPIFAFGIAINVFLFSVYYSIYIPMLKERCFDFNDDNSYKEKLAFFAHLGMSSFLWMNVFFNHYTCYKTPNTGPSYDKYVRELAKEAGFVYPETPEQIEAFKRDFEESLKEKIENEPIKKNSNGGKDIKNLRQWAMVGPFEWGFCYKTNQPKPPRSHYDRVTNTLVPCMDHYCPFLLNSVGYFNYHYFVAQLFYALLGNIYGAIAFRLPYSLIFTNLYEKQMRHNIVKNLENPFLTSGENITRLFPMVPFPDEKTLIIACYLSCFSMCFYWGALLYTHIFLTLNNQTTIENRGNPWGRAMMSRKKWNIPYDTGSWKNNWEQVFGTGNVFLEILLPTRREPEFFRVPYPGSCNYGKRPTTCSGSITTNVLQRKKQSKNEKKL